MTRQTLLLIILVILIVALLPAWPYASSFGYYPSGLILLILVLIILFRL